MRPEKMHHKEEFSVVVQCCLAPVVIGQRALGVAENGKRYLGGMHG